MPRRQNCCATAPSTGSSRQSPVGEAPETVFMFPGGGAQYAGMARDLYDTEPVFRDWMDKAFRSSNPSLITTYPRHLAARTGGHRSRR